MKGLARRVFGFFAGTVRRQLIWGVVLVHAVMMTLFVHDLTLRQQAFLIDSQTEEASNLAQTLSVTAISQMLASDLAGLQELAAAVTVVSYFVTRGGDSARGTVRSGEWR